MLFSIATGWTAATPARAAEDRESDEQNEANGDATAPRSASLESADETSHWRRTISLGPRWAMTLVPREDLYPQYIADPHRVVFGMHHVTVSESEIPNAGSPRYGLRLGGRFGLFRIHPHGDPERGIQLNLSAGFMGQFDAENSTDNVGWDGIYALVASFRRSERWELKTGIHHVSSHVGDEYMLRTLRTRIDYTRHEILLGASRRFGAHWRAYGEGGWAFHRRNEQLQEPGRLQAGFQYEREESLFRGLLGWYVAFDGTAWEEREWQISRTLQAGFLLPSGSRCWRVGFEHYDGRALIGEFFQDDERYLTFGVWLDL